MFVQVRNSGFNIAYAINLAFPISLFRYLCASESLRVFNLSQVVDDGKGPSMIPVIKMALGFLKDLERRVEVCRHALDKLQALVLQTETGLATLQQAGVPVVHKSEQEASERYPPSERGSVYSHWVSLKKVDWKCYFCKADTCLASVQWVKAHEGVLYEAVSCVACAGETKGSEWSAEKLLVWPELEELRGLLRQVPEGQQSCCSCEQQGLREGVAGEFEPAPGNLLVSDLIEAEGTLKQNSSGKRYMTQDKFGGLAVAGKRLDECAAWKLAQELAPSREAAAGRGFLPTCTHGELTLYQRQMEQLRELLPDRSAEALSQDERGAVEALVLQSTLQALPECQASDEREELASGRDIIAELQGKLAESERARLTEVAVLMERIQGLEQEAALREVRRQIRASMETQLLSQALDAFVHFYQLNRLPRVHPF